MGMADVAPVCAIACASLATRRTLRCDHAVRGRRSRRLAVFRVCNARARDRNRGYGARKSADEPTHVRDARYCQLARAKYRRPIRGSIEGESLGRESCLEIAGLSTLLKGVLIRPPHSRLAEKEAKLVTGVRLEFLRRLGCGFGLPQIVHELLQACL